MQNLNNVENRAKRKYPRAPLEPTKVRQSFSDAHLCWLRPGWTSQFLRKYSTEVTTRTFFM